LTGRLSDTALVMLSAASQDPAHLAAPPRLPRAAANAVINSLLRHGLL
jgi:hypothetical protein